MSKRALELTEADIQDAARGRPPVPPPAMAPVPPDPRQASLRLRLDNVITGDNSLVLQAMTGPGSLPVFAVLHRVNKRLYAMVRARARDVLRNHPDLRPATLTYLETVIEAVDQATAFDLLLLASKMSGDTAVALYRFLYYVLAERADIFRGPLLDFCRTFVPDDATVSLEEMARLFRDWSPERFAWLQDAGARRNVALWEAFERAKRPALRHQLFPAVEPTLRLGDGAYHVLAVSRQPARWRDPFNPALPWHVSRSVAIVLLAAPAHLRGIPFVLKENAAEHEGTLQKELADGGAATDVPQVLATDGKQILMDYFPYTLLNDLHRVKGREDLRRMVAAVRSVVQRLQKKKGMVHNDLYPRNVFFDAQGRFVLADFGVASRRKKGAKTGNVFRPAPLPSVHDELTEFAGNLLKHIDAWNKAVVAAALGTVPALHPEVAQLTPKDMMALISE